MTEIPPQNQPPTDANTLDDTGHLDRTRRVRLPDHAPQQPAPPRRSQPRSSSARAAPPSYPPGAPVQPPRRARHPGPPPPSASGLYLPWWSLVMMVLIVAGIAFGLVFVLAELSEPQTPGDQPPRIQIITSQPTLSQDFGTGANTTQGQADFWPTPIPQAQPTATVPLPTPVPSPSLPPGDFVIGARVTVVGVEVSGLNVRSTPGLAGTPLFLAGEGEVFAIVDGPQTVDGLVWWKIEDPNDPSRVGWAARNYLTIQ